MLGLIWLRGLVANRAGRMAATAAGIAVAVGLLAAIGGFVSVSKATMTTRAIADVAVDWQVDVHAGADAHAVLQTVQATPAVRAALPVGFAATTGFEATTGSTTQTTGPGVVLGLPEAYRATFPGELRDLAGAGTGTLIAQQTAANLHVTPGDTISLGRAGLAPVAVRVDGVVDVPQADSLFQKIGAPVGAQPQAPPDNVLLLAAPTWHALFDPLAAARPDLVTTQIHVGLVHALPADPAAAFAAVSGQARRLEADLAGTALVGDNLGAALDATRSDALYAQILFLFLGAPGAAVAGVLTAAVAGGGADRRRRDQALLRARGASTARLVRLAAAEAAVVGALGAAAGLALALVVTKLVLGAARLGATPRAALVWAAGAVLVGLVIAGAAVVGPAWREARGRTVTAGRTPVGRAARAPRWARLGLDAWLLAAGALVFWLTTRTRYALVLAPEGVPTISVSYWALAAPALLWAGSGLAAWRLSDLLLHRGRPAVRWGARLFAGTLAGTVAAAMSRQRRLRNRALVLAALAMAFAASTAVFNATYRQQADVDARLTNGADVTVTESPGASVGPDFAAVLAAIPGVHAVEPLQHRFAYVGADLQDLYGVRPTTIVGATKLQDAYFAGGRARSLIGALAAHPDNVLVSEETVRDFQLHPGDRITLRLQDGRTKQLQDVAFTYIGVAKEFPTAPSDSFIVANADYIAAATGSDAVGTFLVDTTGRSPGAVADDIHRLVGTDAQVSDVVTTRRLVGSSLTAVDLAGLTKIELSFALLLAAAATGLVVGLELAERRRTFAIVSALGATPRQLAGFVWTEAAFVTVGGLVAGTALAWLLSHMLVKVLSGVFDPPPATLAIPWPYLATVVALALAATALAAAAGLSASRRPVRRLLRER